MIDSRRDLKWLWLMFAAFVFIGALAITNQSLWIDEAHSAHKAAQRNIQDLRTSLFGGQRIGHQHAFLYVLHLALG